MTSYNNNAVTFRMIFLMTELSKAPNTTCNTTQCKAANFLVSCKPTSITHTFHYMHFSMILLTCALYACTCRGLPFLLSHCLWVVYMYIDFGMSQHLTHNEVAESFRGSPLYMVSYTAHTSHRARLAHKYGTIHHFNIEMYLERIF